jgi:hypothetical protein
VGLNGPEGVMLVTPVLREFKKRLVFLLGVIYENDTYQYFGKYADL